MGLCLGLQKVEIGAGDDFCWFSFLSRPWGWRAVIFQLSGFYCRPCIALKIQTSFDHGSHAAIQHAWRPISPAACLHNSLPALKKVTWQLRLLQVLHFRGTYQGSLDYVAVRPSYPKQRGWANMRVSKNQGALNRPQIVGLLFPTGSYTEDP